MPVPARQTLRPPARVTRGCGSFFFGLVCWFTGLREGWCFLFSVLLLVGLGVCVRDGFEGGDGSLRYVLSLGWFVGCVTYLGMGGCLGCCLRVGKRRRGRGLNWF